MKAGRRAPLAGSLLAALVLLAAISPVPGDAAVVARISAIATASTHACALTSGGGAKCWGYGHFGQLGTGTTTTSLTAVDVSGLASGVSAVAGGSLSSCALTSSGGVKCWGYGHSGELGTGSKETSLSPVDVVGLSSGVAAVAMGNAFTCALTIAGAVKCWGAIAVAPLITSPSTIPVQIAGLTGGLVAIAAGASHACALTDRGGVKCWGSSEFGQLGNGSRAHVSLPVDVVGLASGVRAISAGWNHSCALMSSGAAKCWGYNGYGQLGDGSNVNTSVPVDVVGLTTGIRAISAGNIHTCAITSGGGAKCWGSNIFGQLGHGTTNSWTPVDVTGLSQGMTAISAGNGYTCAVTSGGGAKCWGSNYYGQLGNGTRTDSRIPVNVDFSTHQAIGVSADVPAGSIASGTAVTFAASVQPVSTTGVAAIVRFAIYRKDRGVWHLAAVRNVAANSTGHASLRWTFVTTGARYVRAQAQANAIYAASPWSPPVRYTVR